MRSPLNYLGGKSRLARTFVQMIPRDHVCYCEPFAGGAWVFFTKAPSQVEVLNDADGELVTFWRVIQNHLEEFLRYYKWCITSRRLFDLEKMKRPETLTDVQRAVRYYYLQRLCFAGKTSSRHFAATPTRPAGLNLSTMEEVLLNVHWRLSGVTIETLDALECVRRYDRPSTFFYLDPPYWNADDYAVKFGGKDYERLRDTLAGIRGRFILSINDVPEIREIFRLFRKSAVRIRYSAGDSRASKDTRSKPRGELLISGP